MYWSTLKAHLVIFSPRTPYLYPHNITYIHYTFNSSVKMEEKFEYHYTPCPAIFWGLFFNRDSHQPICWKQRWKYYGIVCFGWCSKTCFLFFFYDDFPFFFYGTIALSNSHDESYARWSLVLQGRTKLLYRYFNCIIWKFSSILFFLCGFISHLASSRCVDFVTVQISRHYHKVWMHFCHLAISRWRVVWLMALVVAMGIVICGVRGYGDHLKSFTWSRG